MKGVIEVARDLVAVEEQEKMELLHDALDVILGPGCTGIVGVLWRS